MRKVTVDTVRSVGLLWGGWGHVIRHRGPVLLLLFLLGWVGYYLTVMLTGMVAPIWAWVVIPLMGIGCLIQLVITLTAYRLSIRQAEIALDAPKLPEISFTTMVSSLLVPFAAAYSAFGFFTNYARDGVQAAAAMVGTLADQSFLLQVDPFSSVTTFFVVVACFIVLWVAARAIKYASSRKHSAVLALLSSFVSACTTFLALLSISHLKSYLSSWLSTRTYMAWRDNFLSWAGGLVHLDVPHAFSVAWQWLSGTAWPLFWNTLSQPLLWLAVVALVGGMQFIGIDTIWGRARQRLGIREHKLATGLVKKVGSSVVNFISSLLPFFHLLTVIIRSGVPFLGALVVSFTAIQQAGAWLTFAIQRLVGTVPAKYFFLLSPVTNLATTIVVPMAQAILLSVAYVRLRQFDEGMAVARPTGLNWKAFLAVILSLAAAIGLTLVKPGNPYPATPITVNQPVTLLGDTVTVHSVQAGHSLIDASAANTSTTLDDQPYASLGVFVSVKVSVEGYQESSVYIFAESGGTVYTSWDGEDLVRAPAGFRATEDVTFEVPSGSLNGLTIGFEPLESIQMPVPQAQFTVPPGTTVQSAITVNPLPVQEVI